RRRHAAAAHARLVHAERRRGHGAARRGAAPYRLARPRPNAAGSGCPTCESARSLASRRRDLEGTAAAEAEKSNGEAVTCFRPPLPRWEEERRIDACRFADGSENNTSPKRQRGLTSFLAGASGWYP